MFMFCSILDDVFLKDTGTDITYKSRHAYFWEPAGNVLDGTGGVVNPVISYPSSSLVNLQNFVAQGHTTCAQVSHVTVDCKGAGLISN